MKKILLSLTALTAVLLLTGCQETIAQKPNTSKVKTKAVQYGIKVYCDKETNVEYLIRKDYGTGGITPRYNLDGTLKGCK